MTAGRIHAGIQCNSVFRVVANNCCILVELMTLNGLLCANNESKNQSENVIYIEAETKTYTKKTLKPCTVKQAVWPAVGPPQYAPPPASGDLNSHPELSAWRSPRMLVMRVIVLHTYIHTYIAIYMAHNLYRG